MNMKDPDDVQPNGSKVLFAQSKVVGQLSISPFEACRVGAVCAVVLVAGEHILWLLRVHLHMRLKFLALIIPHHPRWKVVQGSFAHPGHMHLVKESVLSIGSMPLLGSCQRVREGCYLVRFPNPLTLEVSWGT